MKAMVFAAGYGTRLGEISKKTPKCLVPLADGSTMLEKVIQRLIKADVKSVVINIHHLADQIKEYVADKKNFGIDIQFSPEETILGTGGGLKKARWFFDDSPFFVHNSDVYSNIDLKTLYKNHISNQALATLAVMARPTTRPLIFSDKNQLVGFGSSGHSSVTAGNPFGFCGIQVIDPKFFSYLEKFENEFSTIPVFFAAAKAGEKVTCHVVSSRAKWIDMGTPEDLEKLQTLIRNGIK